jgi:hypothetical protein
MIKYTKPTNLNGAELIDELISAGVKIEIKDDSLVVENESLWLDISDEDSSKAEEIVLAHNGNTIAPELTVHDKLASVGLNLNDLKVALGL